MCTAEGGVVLVYGFFDDDNLSANRAKSSGGAAGRSKVVGDPCDEWEVLGCDGP